MKNHKVFLAIGANIGDKRSCINKALGLLREKISDIRVAHIYETKPWGYTDQDNFLNTALCGTTTLEPEKLLTFLKEIEIEMGRIKEFTNCPRVIDIDIIFFDNQILKSKDLIIPHPRLHERDFVLKPLLDLEQTYIHPLLNQSLEQLFNKIDPKDYYVIKKI